MSSTNTGIIHSNAHISKAELLEKIGGEAMLHRAVDEFYKRLVNDPELQPFFEHANMTVLKWHQFNIMSMAFTHVPDNFDIKHFILTKHAGMFDSGLSARHYDIVCRHFEETLLDLGVDPAAVADAAAVVRPLRDVFRQGAADSVHRVDAARRCRRAMLAALAAALLAAGAVRLLRSRRK